MMYETINQPTHLAEGCIQELRNPIDSAELKNVFVQKLQNDFHFTAPKIVRCNNTKHLKFGDQTYFFQSAVSQKLLI